MSCEVSKFEYFSFVGEGGMFLMIFLTALSIRPELGSISLHIFLVDVFFVALVMMEKIC